MTRIFAILLTLILLPSLAVAQNGNGGGGGNSLQTQVEELYQLVSDLQAENAALQALIESNTSTISDNAHRISGNTSGISLNAFGISDNASTISGLQTSVGDNHTAIATNSTAIAAIDISDLENAVAYYDDLLDGVSREVVTVNDYRAEPSTQIEVPTLVFSGMNVQIVNGLENTQTANGAGNLIVGYNAGRDGFSCPDGYFCDRRWGSHMLVSGTRNNYTAFGGLMAGNYNETSGSYSSVSGGIANEASGESSSVSGGAYNTAIGESSSVSGGYANTASGYSSSVSGGLDKTASFEYCVVGDDGNDC